MAADPPLVPLVRAFAPAKLNLYLHVTGRRPDGYHLLDSLVVFAGAGDRLSISPAASLRLRVGGRSAATLPASEDNLVLKAVRALAAALGREPAVAIELQKELPVAAGLGGGSADAAAALRGLQALWRVKVAPADLDRIALRLGADVPACLRSVPLTLAGIGEVLTPVAALPSFWTVLVNPGVELGTGAVFAAFDGTFSPPAPITAPSGSPFDLMSALRQRRNDLEAPARQLCPAVGRVLAALEATADCLLARMSGSGASCFGLYASRPAAVRAAELVGRHEPRWWIRAAPILGMEGPAEPAERAGNP